MAVFEVVVYLDTICPWCYIGHRTLDHAIDLYQKTYPGASKDKFEFTWRPYYLNPDASPQAVPMIQRMIEKNGSERSKGIKTRLERVGREHGILFNFNGLLGNTKDSHRLIAFAPLEKRKALVEKLFESHFEQGGDITSRDMLVSAATTMGLNEPEVREYLASGAGGDEIDKLAAEARASGISSVPTVEINGTRIEGAEDAREFYQAFVAARAPMDE